MKKNPHFAQLVYLGLILTLLLTACRTPTPVRVSPVTGLPQGTDGFPWWNDSVFYELFVRSFYDSNGDGIGDFNGIFEKLDYLNDGDPETTSDLGITGIWLMPINPSPSYHGYDVTDYYAVNPDYGSLEDFTRLLEAAHQRGIRVIMDLVINHTSIDHPWFQESLDPNSPRRDWYIWSQENPGYNGPWGEQVWYKAGDSYYYAVFSQGMPDLNLTNPDVIAEIDHVAKFWLELGVDGFRLDAAKHLIEEGQQQENTDSTHEFWQHFRSVYKAINPDAMTVGEVWSSTAEVSRYLKGDELDLAFDFDLAGSILDGISSGNPYKTSLSLQNALSTFKNLEFGAFLANHDQNRVMNRFLFKEEKARLAASMLLTAPGVPFLYYGEEIGMLGAKPDENIRSPFQWSSEANAGFTTAAYPWRLVNSDYPERNVSLMTGDPDSLLSRYRSLIQLRSQHAALRVGNYTGLEVEQSNVLAFLRSSQDEDILVILNFNERPIDGLTLSLPGSTLGGEYTLVPLFGSSLLSGLDLPRLPASETGSFSSFVLLPAGSSLPGYAVLIFQLQH